MQDTTIELHRYDGYIRYVTVTTQTPVLDIVSLLHAAGYVSCEPSSPGVLAFRASATEPAFDVLTEEHHVPTKS